MVPVMALQGRNVLCVREVQNSIADSVKRLIEAKISALGLDAYFEVTDKEIRCPRAGSVIIFRGMQNHTAASVKSLEGFHVAWWEEAQTASRKSLDLLIPTIREPGSELWFSWNPTNASDPVEFLRHDPPPGAIVVEANAEDNPWFPAELRADMERDRSRDPDKYHHVWRGGYEARSETRVFRNWRVEALIPPHNVVWHYGLDFGFAADPTAALRCAIWGHKLYIDAEAYEAAVPTEALPQFLIDRVPGINMHVCRADAARPETIDHLRRHGFPMIRPAKKGKDSVKDGLEFLRGFDIIAHPRCANMQRELTLYGYKTDRQTGDILPEVEDRNNHLVDALRYAVEALHQRGTMIKPEDAPRIGRRRAYEDEDEGLEGSWKVA